MKPKVGFFDFASCEGCQLALLNCEDLLLDLLERIDLVEFREAMSEQGRQLDIAFVEGSIHREEDADRLREIRARSGVLVALGACACIGNVQARANYLAPSEHFRIVYGDDAVRSVQTDAKHWPLWAHTRVRRVSEVVKVDHELRGCPMEPIEFLRLVEALLAGSVPRTAAAPVCTECKRAENVCLFERGEACLGPVTWAGCGAVCVTKGYRCDGCRGLLPHANLEAHREAMEAQGLSEPEVDARFRLFCAGEPGGRR